jgi:hypothetical protein
MTKITEEEALDWYDELLDEGADVNVLGYYYAKSRILKELDPIAYRCGFLDYIDTLTEINIEVEGFEN